MSTSTKCQCQRNVINVILPATLLPAATTFNRLLNLLLFVLFQSFYILLSLINEFIVNLCHYYIPTKTIIGDPDVILGNR